MSSYLASSALRHGRRLVARGFVAQQPAPLALSLSLSLALPQQQQDRLRRWQSSNSSSKQQYEDDKLNTPLPSSEHSSSSEEPEQTPLMERSEKNIFSQFYDKHSLSKQTNRILVAESYLQAASHQASDPRWFGPGRISREFRSYQALLTMHIWFLHKRLISDTNSSDPQQQQQDPHAAALIQEELFDIFWTDSSNRMRAFGVNEMMINKNLKTVQQYTFMHCFHYDHCYTDPQLLENPEERLAELKVLVQTHILLLDPKDSESLALHDDHAERIAWYIETQYQNIVQDLPEDLFCRARIAWVDLPDFSNLKDQNGKELELDDSPIDPDDVFPQDWVRNIANDGTYYYWNSETRKAQWERPN